jgi:hypothetical protein
VPPDETVRFNPPEPDILFLRDIIMSFYIYEVDGPPANAFVGLKLFKCICCTGYELFSIE